ncbi:MAG TPA: carbohydrate ABC transporter permease [Anaerolineae bacterium]|nr:carbohydrate ABC transporter permease [Anaerolineae bacterium]
MPTAIQRSRGLLYKLAVIGRYLLMILLALIFALPIIYMLVSSLKPVWQILQDSSSIRAFLPVGDISFTNYEEAFRFTPILRFLFNSVVVSSLTVISGLIVNSLAAFALSRVRWKGRLVLLSLIVAAIIIPFEAIAIPLLLIVNNLPWIDASGIIVGWLDSYQVQIIPFIADAFSIFLFYQFFKRLPDELFDAARIDGASWFQIFLRVVVPLSGPVYATVAILRFLAMWNQYLWPALVIQTDEFRTLMIGFGYFGGRDGASMAYLTIATIPVLILFFLFQRSFVNSMSASSSSLEN